MSRIMTGKLMACAALATGIVAAPALAQDQQAPQGQQAQQAQQQAQAVQTYPQGSGPGAETYLATAIGRIASLDRDNRTLTLQDGPTFQLGQSIALEAMDLRQGQPVMINFSPQGEQLLALRVMGIAGVDTADMGQDEARQRLQQAYQEMLESLQRGDQQQAQYAQQAGQQALRDLRTAEQQQTQRFQDIQQAEEGFRQQARQLPQMQPQGQFALPGVAPYGQPGQQQFAQGRLQGQFPGGPQAATPAQQQYDRQLARLGQMLQFYDWQLAELEQVPGLSSDARQSVLQARMTTAQAVQDIQNALHQLQQDELAAAR